MENLWGKVTIIIVNLILYQRERKFPICSSCFSKRFGGRCIGTPEGCEECLGVCIDKDPGEYTLTASGAPIKGRHVTNKPSIYSSTSSDGLTPTKGIKSLALYHQYLLIMLPDF